MKPIIQGINLSKNFEHIKAVDQVNIELEEGRFYALMGRSGSGKTTLLSLLGLLDEPSAGDIYINNQQVSLLDDKGRSRLRLLTYGFVFQDFHLNSRLKAYENVMVPMLINPELTESDHKLRATQLLSQLGLEKRANHYPQQLSGGEKQRVAIARALANDPKIIYADEPTGNLDSESESLVLGILKQLSKSGKTVLVVSHNPCVKQYADKTLVMDDGRISDDKA